MGQTDEHTASLNDPEAYWGLAAQSIHWDRPFDRVLSQEPGHHARWFKGGMLNTCYNAVDRHVEGGRADQPALVYDSPLTGTVRATPSLNSRTRSPEPPACSRRRAWPAATG